jgi:hypothetical protein
MVMLNAPFVVLSVLAVIPEHVDARRNLAKSYVAPQSRRDRRGKVLMSSRTGCDTTTLSSREKRLQMRAETDLKLNERMQERVEASPEFQHRKPLSSPISPIPILHEIPS